MTGKTLMVAATATISFMVAYYSLPKKKKKEETIVLYTTPLELLQLVQCAYNEGIRRDYKEGVPLWPWRPQQRIQTVSVRPNEFFGPDVFIDEQRKRVVIVARSISGCLLLRFLQNVNSAMQEYEKTISQIMIDCESKYPDYEWVLTGHSLGAACCEAALAKRLHNKQISGSSEGEKGRNWNCVTFESPGFVIDKKLKETLRNNQKEVHERVIHFLSDAHTLVDCINNHISSQDRRYQVYLKENKAVKDVHITSCALNITAVFISWWCLQQSQRFSWSLTQKVVLMTNIILQGTEAIECLRSHPPLTNMLTSFNEESGYPVERAGIRRLPAFTRAIVTSDPISTLVFSGAFSSPTKFNWIDPERISDFKSLSDIKYFSFVFQLPGPQ